MNTNALKIRITEQYINAMKDIYSTSKIVGLPSGPQMGSDGSGSGGQGKHDLTTELVKAMMVAKETVGSVQGGSGMSPDLNELRRGIEELAKNQQQ